MSLFFVGRLDFEAYYVTIYVSLCKSSVVPGLKTYAVERVQYEVCESVGLLAKQPSALLFGHTHVVVAGISVHIIYIYIYLRVG